MILDAKLFPNFPRPLKYSTTTAIAFLIYLPFAKLAYFAEKLGVDVRNYPLADYRHRPFYQCKNDALDRFGTRLEQRFSRKDIEELLTKAGCDQIKFSDNTPFLVLCGTQEIIFVQQPMLQSIVIHLIRADL